MIGGGPLDDPALVAVCTDLHPRLVGALTLSTGDRAVAEELAQEALARLCERWDAVQQMESLEGWVFTVAFNLVRSWWRRSARGTRAMLRLRAQPAAAPVSQPDVARREWVIGAVAALPARQREVIALRYYADCSVAETAVIMGCAEGTVKSLTAKATGRLRQVLGPAGDDAVLRTGGGGS